MTQHLKKRGQSWWKKPNFLGKSTSITNTDNESNTNNNNNKSLSNLTQNTHTHTNTLSNTNNNTINYIDKDFLNLDENEFESLKNDVIRLRKERNTLEKELNHRSKQINQLEIQIDMLSKQLKTIGLTAMEKEQEIIELRSALELKSKQLLLYRGNNNNNNDSNNNENNQRMTVNKSTILPIHLKNKFTQFLKNVLIQQKIFFNQALNHFVYNSISIKELQYNNNNNINQNDIIKEISLIGNNIMKDYVNELELRLNGVFDVQKDKIPTTKDKTKVAMKKVVKKLKKLKKKNILSKYKNNNKNKNKMIQFIILC